jgi:hypothetical protein
MSGHLSQALEWLTGLLDELSIPYQVVGGLAVRAHGGSRPLVDIDLYVPDAALERIAVAAAPYVVRPTEHHTDAHWNLVFMKLRHSGWQIEIAGSDSARVYDHRAEAWRPAGIRFDEGEERLVAGVSIQVMPLGQLMDYKEGLDREVDRLDLHDLRS